MKNLILCITCFILVFASCKKDDIKTEPLVNPTDPISVSANLIISHSEKFNGSMPAAGTNSERPDIYVTPNYKSVAGKYIIAKPYVNQGDVLGYYVQVKGSSSHYKIDYTQPSEFKAFIVIQLPKQIQAGEFQILVSAFDASGNVSDPQETTITVEKVVINNLLTGTWKMSGKKYLTGPWNNNVYEKRNGAMYSFNCINNKIGNPHSGMDPYPTVITSLQQFQLKVAEFSFDTKAGVVNHYEEDAFIIDYTLSTCDNVVYKFDETSGPHFTVSGDYSYDVNTKEVSTMYNINANLPLNESEFDSFEIIELTGAKLVLKYPWDDYQYEYTKQ